MSIRLPILALVLVIGVAALGQSPNPAPAPGNNAAPTNAAAPANNTPPSPAAPAKTTPVSSTKIPSGSKVYVAPMGGFENYVIAGIVKKKVPVSLVSTRDKAEYEIRGSAETEKAGWAKMLFLGSQNTNEQLCASSGPWLWQLRSASRPLPRMRLRKSRRSQKFTSPPWAGGKAT